MSQNFKPNLIKFKSSLIPVISLTALVYLISSIPYLAAIHYQKDGTKFSGQVSYLTDQNMYFSFIRQAHDGALIFKNRLTHESNKPVFFNIQFLAVGFAEKHFNLSENSTYQVWRFAGALFLVSGFFMLSSLVLNTERKKTIARFMCIFGGGFSMFLFALFGLHLIDETTFRKIITGYSFFDVATGCHPFQQITTNPHFSLPHGIMLLGMAMFILAEIKKQTRLFIFAGLIFAVNGLIRPYDLISVAVIFPIFAVLESTFSGFNFRLFLQRLLPFTISLPCLLYNIWLFKIHPVFKWWSVQGLNADTLSPFYLDYLVFGIAGFLAIIRIIVIKRQPLTKVERFLSIWFVSIYALIFSGQIIPGIGFSPQIGVSLVGPLVLLGLSTNLPASLTFSKARKRFIIFTTVLIAFFTITGTTGVVFYFSRQFLPNRNVRLFYASSDELAGWKWLNDNGIADKVVLAAPLEANRIGKYTSSCLAGGHYSVTPRYENIVNLEKKYFGSRHPDSNACGILSKWNVSYVYSGQPDDSIINRQALDLPCLKPVYANNSIVIFKHIKETE
jgi:hypothetical protein